MPIDNKYLEQRRQGWYCVVEIPPLLREKFGRKRLRASLKTRDINVARARRWAVIKEFKALIEAAKKGDIQADSLTEEAFAWRGSIRAVEGEQDEALSSLIIERAEQIEQERGEEAAQDFAAIAFGRATPAGELVEPWLSESDYTERTKSDHRRAIKVLQDHAGKTVCIERLDRRQAADFITKYLMKLGITNKTVNKYLSSYSSYWTWLIRRGYAKENPWTNQGVPKEPRRNGNGNGAKERPFTDAEIKALLQVPPDETLGDLMLIGALSGMRIEEICSLTVKDCRNGLFDITEAKTPAGVRKVPIHSALVSVVDRRMVDKADTEFLFHELSASGPDGERSMAVSKRFGRYRQSVGVHERPDGKRRSLVNFHSFRRWFITKAEEAGQVPWIVEAVVGHKREGMSLGVYSGGPSVDQRRACVEAVTLPEV
jgi:integrase